MLYCPNGSMVSVKCCIVQMAPGYLSSVVLSKWLQGNCQVLHCPNGSKVTVKCCIVQMVPGIYAKNYNASLGYRRRHVV